MIAEFKRVSSRFLALVRRKDCSKLLTNYCLKQAGIDAAGSILFSTLPARCKSLISRHLTRKRRSEHCSGRHVEHDKYEKDTCSQFSNHRHQRCERSFGARWLFVRLQHRLPEPAARLCRPTTPLCGSPSRVCRASTCILRTASGGIPTGAGLRASRGSLRTPSLSSALRPPRLSSPQPP